MKEKIYFNGIFSYLVLFIWFILAFENSGYCQGWPDIKVRLLPDSSFAFIETDENGQRFRHCPHHGINGELDPEQLIYTMGTIEQVDWLNPKNKKYAWRHLEKHYNRYMGSFFTTSEIAPVNINRASLVELVRLPHIGPVMAVKIIEYREKKASYLTIEDIMKVEGFGIATFHSIKHYIRVN